MKVSHLSQCIKDISSFQSSVDDSSCTFAVSDVQDLKEAAAPGAETEQEAPESAPDAAQESAAQPDAAESQTPADGQ